MRKFRYFIGKLFVYNGLVFRILVFLDLHLCVANVECVIYANVVVVFIISCMGGSCSERCCLLKSK